MNLLQRQREFRTGDHNFQKNLTKDLMGNQKKKLPLCFFNFFVTICHDKLDSNDQSYERGITEEEKEIKNY